MKIKVLASGSKGNCTYVECDNHKFLIDLGISYLQVKNELFEINVDVNDIQFILISHIHSDHIKGLSSFLKHVNATVLLQQEVYNDIISILYLENYNIVDKFYKIDELSIELFQLSHDVNSFGFLINYFEKSFVYITDTGYINKKYIPKLSNKNIYIIEANHDEEMLMNGPYPYILKQRVIGDKGHLSNKYTGRFLLNCIGDNTEYIFLAHISEHNNTKDLALKQVKNELRNVDFDKSRILITDQYISLDLIEV